LWMLDAADRHPPRLLATDPRAADGNAGDVHEIALTDVLASHPRICGKEDDVSGRLTVRDSELRVTLDGGEPRRASMLELRAADRAKPCAVAAQIETNEQAARGERVSESHAWIDLTHPESSVMVRRIVGAHDTRLEYRTLRCAASPAIPKARSQP
ncbi:MAG: hypothetical protein ACRELB_12205, partial [Polyangiaceae bacterium]